MLTGTAAAFILSRWDGTGRESAWAPDDLIPLSRAAASARFRAAVFVNRSPSTNRCFLSRSVTSEDMLVWDKVSGQVGAARP